MRKQTRHTEGWTKLSWGWVLDRNPEIRIVKCTDGWHLYGAGHDSGHWGWPTLEKAMREGEGYDDAPRRKADRALHSREADEARAVKARLGLHDRIQESIEENIALESRNRDSDSKLFMFAAQLVEHNRPAKRYPVVDGYTGGV